MGNNIDRNNLQIPYHKHFTESYFKLSTHSHWGCSYVKCNFFVNIINLVQNISKFGYINNLKYGNTNYSKYGYSDDYKELNLYVEDHYILITLFYS